MSSLSLCRCGGEGSVERNGKLYECVCAALRRVAASMPPYVRRANIMPGHLVLPVIKMVRKSAFITGSWPDVKAVIKAAMIKNMNLSMHITSDREIRDVFVGSTSRAAKGGGSGLDDEGVMNSLKDLMDPPSLSIVRLNELSYKNRAAPGALEEALSYRIDRDRPTWVVSDTSRPFGPGSHAYSDTVMELLDSAFMRVMIPMISSPDHSQASAAPSALSAAAPMIQGGGMQGGALPTPAPVGAVKKPRAPAPPPTPVFIMEEAEPAPAVPEDDGLGIYSKGVDAPKTRGRSSFRKGS